MKFNSSKLPNQNASLWQKGCASPNPNGRPKGSKNKAPSAIRAMLAEQIGEEIPVAALSYMRSGDTRAFKCVLDKLVPNIKSEAVELDLPEIASVQDAKAATTRLLKAASCGEVTIQEAREMMALIQDSMKVFQ